MATVPKAEYVGFTVNQTARVYRLRVSQPDGETRDFTLSIANRAFLSNRVRYQDAPEICFLKLEREILAHGDKKMSSSMQITNDELDDYRQSHDKRPLHRRPRASTKH
jgi:hypothetical protein